MKRIIVLILLMLSVVSICGAYPVRSDISNKYTELLPLVTGETVYVGIGKDALIFNLYQTNYPNNGIITAPIRYTYKDGQARDDIRAHLTSIADPQTTLHPELFSYTVDYYIIDTKNGTYKLLKEYHYNSRGQLLAVYETNSPETINYKDGDHPLIDKFTNELIYLMDNMK